MGRTTLTAAAFAGLALIATSCSASQPAAFPDSTVESIVGNVSFSQQALTEQLNSAISQCMRNAGFEWQAPPTDPAEAQAAKGVFGAPTPASLRAYRLEYGYGVVQQVDVLAARQVIYDQGDPQSAYLAQLDSSSLTAYDGTLYGTDNSEGCQAVSEELNPGVAVVETLYTEYTDVLDRYFSDPRVIAAEQDTLACLGKQGYVYDSVQAIYEDFQLQLVDMLGGTSQRDDKGRLVYSYGPESTDDEPLMVQTSALDALRERELKMAAAEMACAESHDAELGVVLDQLSASFVESNRSDLAAYTELASR